MRKTAEVKHLTFHVIIFTLVGEYILRVKLQNIKHTIT